MLVVRDNLPDTHGKKYMWMKVCCNNMRVENIMEVGLCLRMQIKK